MTAKEALEYFKRRKELIGLSDRVQQAEDLAIKALEKQIPKKPIINKRKIQCVNGHNQPTQHYKYCPMCGQLMDWSETE